jgi:phosphocarrier protein FPr
MTTLSSQTVRLGASPATKAEAIGLAAGLLAAAGHIDPAYRESMWAREKVANTYLGEGIAIPHGMLKDRELIKSTGLSVVQVPGGVEWNPGEQVRLVVGIAAASDEHLQILANLTRVLGDEKLIEELVTTDDAEVIVSRLTGEPAPAAPAPAGQAPDLAGYARAEVVVPLEHGLHARPATELVTLASGFAADVRVQHGDRVANGKSLASLLSIGAGSNARITLLARGDDQDAALAALTAAVESGLGEAAEAPGPATPPQGAIRREPAVAFRPVGEATAVPGVAASPGIAIGPLWHLKRRRLVVERTAQDPGAELRRLRAALESARAELSDLHDEVAARSGEGEAAIFRAHAAFLDDPDLTGAAERTIREGHSAGWAWREVVEAQAADLRGLDDPVLAGRAADLGDVGERVLRYLAEADDDAPRLPDHPVVLLADDLTPSDTAGIDPAAVVGFATAAGGPTSHIRHHRPGARHPRPGRRRPRAALAARGRHRGARRHGRTLWVGVGEPDLAAARRAQHDLEDVREAEHRRRYEPAFTTDGHRVEVVANIGAPAEAAAAVEAGAEGVGLLRTEFLFLGRDEPPDEDEQHAALVEMVTALNGLPLVVRTMDIGGDKQVPYIDLPAEEGSFLGIRGIRLSLARPTCSTPSCAPSTGRRARARCRSCSRWWPGWRTSTPRWSTPRRPAPRWAPIPWTWA